MDEQREKLHKAKAEYSDQGFELLFFNHPAGGFKGCLMMEERVVGGFELTQISDGAWVMAADLPKWTTGPLHDAGFHVIESI